MAVEFVIEDGTSKTDATSYATVSQFVQYWENRGVDYSSLSSTVVEAYLNLATEYIDNNYSFLGTKSDEDQALEFPRYGILINDMDYVESDEIPQKLINATCFMASKTSSGEIEKEQDGVISESFGNVSKTYNRNQKKYTVCNKLLSDYVLSGNKLIRVN